MGETMHDRAARASGKNLVPEQGETTALQRTNYSLELIGASE